MKHFLSAFNQIRIFIASVAGTSAMTLYSYLVSWGTGHNFKEPKLLGQLANRFMYTGKKSTPPVGWTLHYLVGCLFAESYLPFWTGEKNDKIVKRGLILGGLSGIAAILIWKFTFDVHGQPPSIPFAKFGGQLFIAHVIFGFVTAIAFNLFAPGTPSSAVMT